MNKIRYLLLTTSLVYSNIACAQIQHTQYEYCSALDYAEDCMVIGKGPQRDNSNLIKDAAIAAGAAYNDSHLVEAQSNANRYQNGFSVRKKLAETHEILNFSGKGAAGIIACKEDNGKLTVTISYHGTESDADLDTDKDGFKLGGSTLNLDGYVHGGFHKRYMESREAMIDAVCSVLDAYGKNAQDVDFVVTGHSLGAALATLAAVDIKNNISADAIVNLVTFSSPRVVDNQGAHHIERILGPSSILRIWRENDPISMVSIGSKLLFGYYTGYKHVGQSIKLEAKSYGWSSFLSLENHRHDHHMDDASSPTSVKILNHEGKRDFIKRQVTALKDTLSSITAPVTRFFSKAVNFFNAK